MEGSYNNIANNYYKFKVRVLFAIDFFKGKVLEDIDNELIATYRTMLGNVEAAYHNLIKAKAELDLPLNDLDNYQGDGFVIHRGRLYGDIAKAREYAERLISENRSNSDKDPECNRQFELGLFLMQYGSKIKKDFLAIPDFAKSVTIGAEPEKSVDTIVHHVEGPEQAIKVLDTKPTCSGANNIFSIFNKINTPNIALG